jgi:hypothetical protein
MPGLGQSLIDDRYHIDAGHFWQSGIQAEM